MNRFAHALISEDDEFGPLGSRTYLSQTEDQMYATKSSPLTGLSSPFQSSSQNGGGAHSENFIFGSPSLIPLDPPISDEDYNFTLGENEGIADLFDEDSFMLPLSNRTNETSVFTDDFGC